jgi:calcium-binding protein CML
MGCCESKPPVAEPKKPRSSVTFKETDAVVLHEPSSNSENDEPIAAGNVELSLEGDYEAAVASISILEQKIVGILKTRKEQQLTGGQATLTMNKIIMKFVSIEETLSGLRSSFKQFDTDCSGFIDYEELKNAMNGIGCTCDDTLLKQIFAESDFNENQKLDFKEFIVALALACLLKVIPEEVANSKLELMNAFTVILDAWLLFDAKATGLIDKLEMVNALNEKGEGGGVFSKERWEEADANADGSITFKEFLFMFVSWVGIGTNISKNVMLINNAHMASSSSLVCTACDVSLKIDEEGEEEEADQSGLAGDTAASGDGCVLM